MNPKALVILGVAMIAVGVVWIFQGIGQLGGSFMTGQPLWAWIGAGTAAVGALVLLWAAFGRA